MAGPLDQRCTIFIGLRFSVGSVNHVCSDERADKHENEDDDAGGDEELGAATPFIGVDGAEDGAGEGDDVLEAVEEEAGVVVGYSGALKHGGVVILFLVVR